MGGGGGGVLARSLGEEGGRGKEKCKEGRKKHAQREATCTIHAYIKRGVGL